MILVASPPTARRPRDERRPARLLRTRSPTRRFTGHSAAGDDWAIAMAANARAMAAAASPSLRQRVDHAACLLERGRQHLPARDVARDAAYRALVNGDDRDAKELVARAIPLVRGIDSPYLLDAAARQPRTGGAADRRHGRAPRIAFREELALCRQLVVLPLRLRRSASASPPSPRYAGNPDRAARLSGAAAAHRYASPRTPSTPDSTSPSSSPPGLASDLTHGMPPLAKAPRSASRTRSPTPSTKPPPNRGSTSKGASSRTTAKDSRCSVLARDTIDTSSAIEKRPRR